MFNPLCGFSLQRAAKIIAIVDLVICCFWVMAHFVGGGYIYEKQYEQYHEELSLIIEEAENQTQMKLQEIEKEEPEDQSIQFMFIPFNPYPPPPPTPQPSLTFSEFHQLLTDSLPSMDIMMVLGICVVLFSIAHVCSEIWLTRLLLKAAAHKDGGACKIWFWFRLGVTILFSMYSFVGIITVKIDVVDWICEFVNIYRVYSLIIIYQFKKEISESLVMIKPR